ncbi:MAG: hypothetical protein V4812_04275 [Pseudomonadota bacterium]
MSEGVTHVLQAAGGSQQLGRDEGGHGRGSNKEGPIFQKTVKQRLLIWVHRQASVARPLCTSRKQGIDGRDRYGKVSLHSMDYPMFNPRHILNTSKRCKKLKPSCGSVLPG